MSTFYFASEFSIRPSEGKIKETFKDQEILNLETKITTLKVKYTLDNYNIAVIRKNRTGSKHRMKTLKKHTNKLIKLN